MKPDRVGSAGEKPNTSPQPAYQQIKWGALVWFAVISTVLVVVAYFLK